MKDKKRKSFYNNKHRNEKWTEEPKGRKIDFADKYAYTDGYSDKYNETTRVAHQTAIRKKEKTNSHIRRCIAFVLALVFIAFGYIAMDTHIIRYARPAKELLQKNEESFGTMSQLDVDLNSVSIDPISLDNSSMLDSVIEEVRSLGYNSITFDAKRTDGTVGYQSKLATIDTYSAMSNFGAEPKKSIQKLISNDILPVARICCYMDNTLPVHSEQVALMKDGKLYRDKQGNTYLDPDNDANFDYIQDIVTELYEYGVTVFVLTGCELPDDAGSVSNNGFKTLSTKLSVSLQGEVKFIEEVDVRIDGIDTKSGKVKNSIIKKQLNNLDILDRNKVYYISSEIDDKQLLNRIKDSRITSFIIA